MAADEDHYISPQVDVFGISYDQQNIGQSSTSPLVWAVGLTRDPSINYTSLNKSVQLRSSYFWSNFSTPKDAVMFFEHFFVIPNTDVHRCTVVADFILLG